MSNIDSLIKMSNTYGADERFVLAGGGNTSLKENGVLYIKGSGTSLATINENGFVKMDVEKLKAMLEKSYSGDTARVEAAVLRDMMDARLLGEEDKRPSVETLLHMLIPFKLVLHLHPALVNGLTCGKDGEKAAEKLFGNTALFMRATKPGYILSMAAKKETDAHSKKNGSFPTVIFMQNHGVFFGADTLDEMNILVNNTMEKLKGSIKREYDFTEVSPADIDVAVAHTITLRTLYKKQMGKSSAVFTINKEILKVSSSAKTFEAALSAPFTPDHIVYCKHKPLYIEKAGDEEKAFNEFVKKYGFAPKAAVIKNVGLVTMGSTKKEADIAAKVFLDGIKIAVYSESFGGQLFMTDEDVDFILNWEVESYRQKVSLGADPKRLNQKSAFITGGAQGYGRGIAELMAENGANVVIADLNYDGAKAAAQEIEAAYGKGCAMAVKVDVSSEEDVKSAMDLAVLNFGGLDILVNNAGVVKAGSLDEMDIKSFEFVTRINYNAYFICAKYASKLMKIAHNADESVFYDIIQINSKSGLAGSNKNFAYAGSKFGGIGLTQSFALELAPYNIKVNSVCPGNFFEGPLWSDPEKGLFVQYLNAGKVPGAKTVADVKKSYEDKIPMGRGCHIEDVVRAIMYVVEQAYETGQAIPVTGGQEMLK